jgi:hypothetical protein
MTSLAASRLTPSAAPRELGKRFPIFSWLVEAGALFAAAARVARAVESRRDPAEADLQVLGIPSPLPKRW